jgi:hypothetical protein
MISLFWKLSVLVFRRRVRGAMKTGDSKQTAISLRNRLLAKKLRLGKSRAKLMNLSFSFFSMRAMVLLMYVEYPSASAYGIFCFYLDANSPRAAVASPIGTSWSY